MTKRQDSANQTKDNLIKTAISLLKESGFDAINVEDITQAAGVAKGTFYTHFKRKEDIVLEISRTPFLEIKRELDNKKDMKIVEKLTHYFYRFMECVEAFGIHICREWAKDALIPNEIPQNKDGEKWAYDFEMLKSILDKAVDDKELKTNTPVELITHVLITQLYGMMTCWCMSNGEFKPLDWTDKFCKIQLKSILEPYLE